MNDCLTPIFPIWEISRRIGIDWLVEDVGRFSGCVDGVVEDGVVSRYSIDHVRIPY